MLRAIISKLQIGPGIIEDIYVGTVLPVRTLRAKPELWP
jgi:hypothetical protein